MPTLKKIFNYESNKDALTMSDSDLKRFMQMLCDKNERFGYMAVSILSIEAQTNPKVYHYIDFFFKMLDHADPALRRRGIAMITVCSSMDTRCRIDKNIQKLLSHSLDQSPIVSVECLKNLPDIVKNKPSVANTVFDFLIHADISVFDESLQTFVQNEFYRAITKVHFYISKSKQN